MRHLSGLVFALVASAALFFGGGAGAWLFIQSHGAAAGLTLHALTTPSVLGPLAGLVGTGLLVGILVAVRPVSPLGPGLPGLALLAWSGLLVARGAYALTFVPLASTHYAAGFSRLLVSGVLAMIGSAMIVPLLMPSRWRPQSADEFGDDFDVPTAIGLTAE